MTSSSSSSPLVTFESLSQDVDFLSSIPNDDTLLYLDLLFTCQLETTLSSTELPMEFSTRTIETHRFFSYHVVNGVTGLKQIQEACSKYVQTECQFLTLMHFERSKSPLFLKRYNIIDESNRGNPTDIKYRKRLVQLITVHALFCQITQVLNRMQQQQQQPDTSSTSIQYKYNWSNLYEYLRPPVMQALYCRPTQLKQQTRLHSIQMEFEHSLLLQVRRFLIRVFVAYNDAVRTAFETKSPFITFEINSSLSFMPMIGTTKQPKKETLFEMDMNMSETQIKQFLGPNKLVNDFVWDDVCVRLTHSTKQAAIETTMIASTSRADVKQIADLYM